MAIDPATRAAVLEEILLDVDQVLVMRVNPGFGNHRFLETALPKIRRVREMIEGGQAHMRSGLGWGHRFATGRLAVEAGAKVLVACHNCRRLPEE